jgi:flavin-dependent dehydrogenase
MAEARNDRQCWDVLVVGAGPAGTLAARGLARAGLGVLLVDKATFPRWKVCGCCLNPHAQATLAAVGLGALTQRCGAVPLQGLRWASRGSQTTLGLSGWVSLSRQRLDAALVEAAQHEGATFLPATQARLGPLQDSARTVFLRSEPVGEETAVSARLVLAADGLGGRFLAGADDQSVTVAAGSRIGAGVVTEDDTDCYAPGLIFMAHGPGGYLGLVRLEDGRLNLAAAFDAHFLRGCHHPGRAALKLLAGVGWPAPSGLGDLRWRGTPALTRRPLRPAAERVLALGDAAGYVEPFTGEGMAWALAAGAAVVPLSVQAAQTWTPLLMDDWARLHATIVTRRQWVCRGVAWLTRHPSLTRLVLTALDQMPWLASPVLRQIGAPSAT